MISHSRSQIRVASCDFRIERHARERAEHWRTTPRLVRWCREAARSTHSRRQDTRPPADNRACWGVARRSTALTSCSWLRYCSTWWRDGTDKCLDRTRWLTKQKKRVFQTDSTIIMRKKNLNRKFAFYFTWTANHRLAASRRSWAENSRLSASARVFS